MLTDLPQRIDELRDVIRVHELWAKALAEAKHSAANGEYSSGDSLRSIENHLDQGVRTAVPDPRDAGLSNRILDGDSSAGRDGLRPAFDRAQRALTNGWAECQAEIAAELSTTQQELRQARAHLEFLQAEWAELRRQQQRSSS